jgi:hypothetical protein
MRQRASRTLDADAPRNTTAKIPSAVQPNLPRQLRPGKVERADVTTDSQVSLSNGTHASGPAYGSADPLEPFDEKPPPLSQMEPLNAVRLGQVWPREC